jgi:hypothetical protein
MITERYDVTLFAANGEEIESHRNTFAESPQAARRAVWFGRLNRGEHVTVTESEPDSNYVNPNPYA